MRELPMQETVTEATRARIAAKAYELFAHRGYQHGRDVEDWLAAEAALQAELVSGSHPVSSRSTKARPAHS